MSYDKIERINRLLTQVSIDVDKGEIRWSERGPKRTLGSIAGSIISGGYRSIWFSGNRIQYHQVIFYAANGYLPENGRVIDHIDRNRTNNKISNLRDFSIIDNARNRNINKNSTSGHVGVHFLKRTGKWTAQIYCDKKIHHLGSFDTKKEAIESRIKSENSFYNKQ